MITDAQVHLWKVEPSDPRPERPSDHQLKNPNGFRAEDLMREMDAIGVDRAVVCPPSSMMKDATGYALESAEKYPGRIGIMDHFNPTEPNAKEHLAKLKNTKNVLGIRLGLRGPGAKWLEDDTLDWVWADCERMNMPVTCLTSVASEKLAPVAAKHPGLRITIDHMGRVPDVKGRAAFAGNGALKKLVPYPNVGVKMTSVPDSSAEKYPFRDLYDGIKEIYEAFGGRRLLWGSDLSGLSSSYQDCLNQFREGLDFIKPEDKEYVLGKNLSQFYSWAETK